jgi:hypothetical protein
LADPLALNLQYREHRVYHHRGDALLLRVCFERLSDGKYAVCQTELLREADDLAKRLSQAAVTTAELLLDPEQPTLWDFRASLSEAIDAHDQAFAEMNQWIANAEN